MRVVAKRAALMVRSREAPSRTMRGLAPETRAILRDAATWLLRMKAEIEMLADRRAEASCP
jgi:hypothetical protein